MIIHKILPIIISLALTGCATKEAPQNVTYGWLGKSFSFENNASYVQWNKEYAVTVAHFVSQSYLPDYKSKYVDIQFIKLKSENIPKWTDFKPLEKISMIGFPSTDKHEKKVDGKITGQLIKFMGFEIYQLVTGKIQAGMSGGPVVNDKNEVVGINIGYTMEPITVNNNTEIHSLFLPYSEIKKEWDIFQKIRKSQ